MKHTNSANNTSLSFYFHLFYVINKKKNSIQKKSTHITIERELGEYNCSHREDEKIGKKMFTKNGSLKRTLSKILIRNKQDPKVLNIFILLQTGLSRVSCTLYIMQGLGYSCIAYYISTQMSVA